MWYVIPRALNGTETMGFMQKQVDRLNRAYVRILKQLQSLPTRCSSAAAYLLIGALPVEAMIHLRILTLLGSISRCSNQLITGMAIRQLALRSISSKSWFVMCQKLNRYSLPDVMDVISDQPTKESWKLAINKAVKSYWFDKLHQTVLTQTSLCHVKLSDCSSKNQHQVWTSAVSSRDVYKAAIKAKMLCGVYLTMNHANKMFPNVDPSCPLCRCEKESLEHVLLSCPGLHKPRAQHLPQLINICRNYNPELWKQLILCPDLLLQFILDCSMLSVPSEVSETVECISRNLCFSVHSMRAFLLTSIDPKHVSYKPFKTS